MHFNHLSNFAQKHFLTQSDTRAERFAAAVDLVNKEKNIKKRVAAGIVKTLRL